MIEVILTMRSMYSNSQDMHDTLIINVDKQSRRPSRRQSVKFTTLIFNLIKVEDIQLVNGRIQTRIQYFVGNKSQKFKLINLLHKDMINLKIYVTVIKDCSVVILISILRCVICLVRISRRVKSSLSREKKDNY